MDVTLISRFFDNRNEGIGNYSKMIYEGLKNEKTINLTLLSQDDSILPKNIFSYLIFSNIEILSKLKNSDIYHALSPLDSFKINKNKSVVTIHDLMTIKIPNRIYNNELMAKTSKLIFEKAMNASIKCNEIVAISEETANDLNKYYNIDQEDIHVIRQAIANHFHLQPSENDSYTVGTVSNLNNRKRVDILIKAFLKANINNSKLLIGGKGPQLEQLMKLTNNDDRIKFLGFIPDNKMNEFYNSLDVFVFPSFMEGYGLPMVEAMACCKPVITLEDAFIPEDVKKRTHITTKSNLAALLKSRDFTCDIESNLKFAKEHTIENMTKNIMNIYKSIF